MLSLETIPAIPTPKIFFHIVTLVHRESGRTETLTVETTSDRFTDVLREIAHQKVMNDLQGYEIFGAIDCNDSF